jgi:hypothetical protein
VQVLPIPLTDEHLNKTFPLWFPFLAGIARRSKETVQDLMAAIGRKDIQPILMWDEAESKAYALLGIRLVKRDDDLIAEWVWMTGREMQRWVHLLPEVEKYLKQHLHCAGSRPICRPGWSRLLRKHGYKITHYTMEKVL